MRFLALLVLAISLPSFGKPVNCPSPAQPYARLTQSCLGQVLSSQTTFDNLKYFEPNYSLYSNGADKRRWVYLPQNTKIDTTNPDGWIYPVGTIFWKEFSLAGRKIETRVFEKVKAGNGPSAWRNSLYLWREDQTEADFTSDGRTTSVNVRYEFTNHKENYTVPYMSSCTTCHRGSADMALGFSYLNLSGNEKAGYRLSHLSQDKWLHPDVTKPDSIAGSDKDKKALGYIHMNCASCHSPTGYANYLFHMNHVSGATEVTKENGYKNTVNVFRGSRAYIHGGYPEKSYIFQRLSNGTMPPDFAVQKHGIDEKAKSMMYEWIENLPKP